MPLAMTEEHATDRDVGLIERSRRLVAESIAIRKALREEQAAAYEATEVREASIAISPVGHQARKR